MTELYLDGQLAVIEPGTKFKIVFDNPYFTKSSTYTHDISLPLAGCGQNQRVFRHINRPDVSKSPQTPRAILISNNKVLVNGTAIIREISETKVQVQLLAGNAELNLNVSGKKYIDELDLGYRVDTPDKFIIGEETDIYWGSPSLTDTVYFPIFNESAGEIYNRIAANYTIIGGTERESLYHYDAVYYKWCVQPYFCSVIKRILKAVGYNLVENQIENSIFGNLFICNATVVDNIEEILPHWTINEFFTQVEKLMGVIFVVDECTKTVRLIFAHQYFESSDKVYLEKVIDTFTDKVDAEETTDLSNANIGYSLADSDALKYKKLSEDVMKKITLKKYNSDTELNDDYNQMSDYEKSRYIFEASNIQYIHYYYENESYGLKEVNQYRDLIRNPEKSDLDIELNIIPATMVTAEAEVYAPGTIFDKNLRWSGQISVPSMPGGVYSSGADRNPTVQDLIDGSVEEKYKPDKIIVAFNEGKMKTLFGPNRQTHAYPIAFVHYADDDEPSNTQNFPAWSLRFYDKPGVKCIGSEIYDKVKKINTTVEETRSFISSQIYNSKSVFVIDNKEYVCKKIEIEADAEGIKELQEATLYELRL